MLFKPVENTVGKGEIAHYEQFLIFPQCFYKARFPGASKGVVVWEWVKMFIYHNKWDRKSEGNSPNSFPTDKYLGWFISKALQKSR